MPEPPSELGYCGCPKKPAAVGGRAERKRGFASFRRNATEYDSDSGGNFQFGANMQGNFSRIIINEVADAVMGDAAEFGPLADGSNRWLLADGKNPAESESDNVGKLRVDAGSGCVGWVHAYITECQHGGHWVRAVSGGIQPPSPQLLPRPLNWLKTIVLTYIKRACAYK